MKTFVVWVLYVSAISGNGHGTGQSAAVIDNIASRQNCQALATRIADATPGRVQTLCVAVRKVAP